MESTPDLEEIQQEEEERALVVPVKVVETLSPVRVQLLPSRHGVSRSYTTDSTDAEPVPLLGGDLRRRRATIIAIGAAIYVGDREMVKQGQAAQWPELVPLVIEHTEQVYARAATTSATVSVISENWAD
jgi:hypothetical protein